MDQAESLKTKGVDVVVNPSHIMVGSSSLAKATVKPDPLRPEEESSTDAATIKEMARSEKTPKQMQFMLDDGGPSGPSSPTPSHKTLPTADDDDASLTLVADDSSRSTHTSTTMSTSFISTSNSNMSELHRSVNSGSKTTLSSGNLRRLSSVTSNAMRKSSDLRELNTLRFDKADSFSGRSKEVKALKEAYVRLCTTSTDSTGTSDAPAATPASGVEMVLLSGVSGTGKTTVVQHFATRYVRRESRRNKSSLRKLNLIRPGNMGTGKFDLRSVGKPFGAFSAAFQDICHEILLLRGSKEDGHRYVTIRDKLREGLGDSVEEIAQAHSLLDMVPYLREIIDISLDESTNNGETGDGLLVIEEKQALSESIHSVRELRRSSQGPRALQQFCYQVRTFVRAISSRENPTVLFLDDMQWASESDLELIKTLALDRDMEGLFLIGCYRDDEVDESHKLSAILETIESSDKSIVNVTPISIGNLEQESICSWLENLLSLEYGSSGLKELSEIVHSRTGGNAFFVRQFLTSLRDERLLSYSTSKYCWTWDAAEIKSKTTATDNVVGLVMQKIERSLSDTQAMILGVASCLGASFDPCALELAVPDFFSALDQKSDGVYGSMKEWANDIAMCMEICVKEGILEVQESRGSTKRKYRFLHDQVQLAAFEKIFDEEHKHPFDFQSRIGRALIQGIDIHDESQSDLLFVAVDLMNYAGTSPDLSNDERIHMAELNLEAANRANNASAFGNAVRYLRWGVEIMRSCPNMDYWEEHRELTLALFGSAAEAEYTVGNFTECRDFVDETLRQSSITFNEKIRLYKIQILSLTAENSNARAVEVCLDVLAQLGVDFPSSTIGMKTGILPSLIKTKKLLKGRDVASLADLQQMEDETKLLALDVMGKLQTCSYIAKPDLLPLVILKSVRWSVKYGNSMHSLPAYASYGSIMSGVFGDLKGGYEFGKLSLALLEKTKERSVEARTKFIVHYGMSHWVLPLQNTLGPFQETYRIGLHLGDVESAIFCIHWFCLGALNSGKPLSSVEEDMRKFALQMKDQNQTYTYDAHAASWQFTLNLLGHAEDPRVLRGEAWTEQLAGSIDVNEHLQMQQRTRECWLAYYFHQYQDAWELAKKTPDLKKACLGASIIWRHSFYVGLTAYALAKKTKAFKWKKQASRYHNEVKKWHKAGNVNCHHMLKIFDAEKAVLKGEKEGAVKGKYDEAITLTARYGLRQDSALANELAGQYFLSRDQYWANHYLQCALRLYEEWEAFEMADHMREIYASSLK